jgi:hypothetical protein
MLYCAPEAVLGTQTEAQKSASRLSSLFEGASGALAEPMMTILRAITESTAGSIAADITLWLAVHFTEISGWIAFLSCVLILAVMPLIRKKAEKPSRIGQKGQNGQPVLPSEVHVADVHIRVQGPLTLEVKLGLGDATPARQDAQELDKPE